METIKMSKEVGESGIYVNTYPIPVFILEIHPDNVLFDCDSKNITENTTFTVTVDINNGKGNLLKSNTLLLKVDKGEGKYFVFPIDFPGNIFRITKTDFDSLQQVI